MKKIYLLFITLISLHFGYGQDGITLAAYSDTNIISNPTPTAVGTIGYVIAKGFTRGPGVAPAGIEGQDSYKTKNWNATSAADAIAKKEYIEWSITAAKNYIIDFKRMEIGFERTEDGPTKFLLYFSLNNFATSGVAAGVEKAIKTTTIYDYYINSQNVKIVAGGTLSLRLYAYDAKSEEGEFHLVGNPAFGANDIANPAVVINGTVAFDGLVYSNGTWAPNAPSNGTVSSNALIDNGTYSVADNTNIRTKNLMIAPGAGIIVPATSSITVLGNLTTSNNLVLESTSKRYSSLIVGGTVTGNATYKRFVNIRGVAGTISNNDLISAPVTGQAFNNFAEANQNIVRNSTGSKLFFGPFDKATGAYVTWAPTHTALLEPAVGYRAATSGETGSKVSFTGTVNTGTVTIPIVKAGPFFQTWNLIGNPYPSYISFDKFLVENAEALDEEASAVYGHNGKDALVEDPWTVWNFNTLTTARIAPGQGFLVSSKNTSETITFTNTMREPGGVNDDDFIEGRPSIQTNSGFFKLNVSDGAKNSRTEFYFNNKSTKGLDPGYDASVYGKKAPEFAVYSHLIEGNKGSDMAIQSLAFSDLSSDLRIPLGINASSSKKIVLSISESDLPEDTEVYLEDNITNTFTLLTSSDYTFTPTSRLSGTGRFFLHVNNRTLSSPDANVDQIQIFTAAKSNSLYIKGYLYESTLVGIYDVQGRLVSSSQLKSHTNSNQLDTSSLSSGIYVVKLTSPVLNTSQKVIIR